MDEAYARDGLVHELIEDFDLYSELGWRAVPVRGKKAMLKWKPAPAQSAVRRTLESGNATGLAIILGASGLVVRDFDDIEAYRRWAELHPALAGELPTALTPRPGFHIYARSSVLISTRAPEDGELRAGVAYVVGPASLHRSGGRYQWVNPPTRKILQIEPEELLLPGQNLGLSQAKKTPSTPTPNACVRTHQGIGMSLGASRPRRMLVTAETDPVEFVEAAICENLPTGPGQRNNCLFLLARYLRHAYPIETPAEELEPLVRAWHARALPMMTTKAFAESWADFRRAWGYTWNPSAFLSNVRARAAGDDFSLGGNGNLDLVARVFRAADSEAGGTAFFLAYRIVDDMVGARSTPWITRLANDGLLKLLEPGRYARRRRDRRANVWRWLGPVAA